MIFQNKSFVLIGGMHKSGTTTLEEVLSSQPRCSGLRHDKSFFNEGAVLFNKRNADNYFGEFLFPLHPHSTKTECSPDLKIKLLKKYAKRLGPYWDLNQPILVEKSPINIMQFRYYQSFLPYVHCIAVYQDPRISFISGLKTSKKTCFELYLKAWNMAYSAFIHDSQYLSSFQLVDFSNINSTKNFGPITVTQYIEFDAQTTDKYKDQWNKYWAANKLAKPLNSILGHEIGFYHD